MNQPMPIDLEEVPAALAELPTSARHRLGDVVRELEPSKAAIVAGAFGAMFAKLEDWELAAKAIGTVESVDDKRRMGTARLLRLEIKQARVELDKRRKAMKAGLILEGKAIDGAFAIFESFASPLENHLHEQETYAARIEVEKERQLGAARLDVLLALGMQSAAMPPALGKLPEGDWLTVLEDAKAARDAREERARIEEDARKEALRLAEERREQAAALERERLAKHAAEEIVRKEREAAQLAENERLRKEFEAERAKAVEEMRHRAESDRRLRDAEIEREQSQARERELLEAKVEQERLLVQADERAYEAEKQRDKLLRETTPQVQAPPSLEGIKPTRARFTLLLSTLGQIAAFDPETANPRRLIGLAQSALRSISESTENEHAK